MSKNNFKNILAISVIIILISLAVLAIIYNKDKRSTNIERENLANSNVKTIFLI